MSGREVLTLTDRELADRLSWFIRIRWFVGAGAVGLLLLGRYLLGVRFVDGGGREYVLPALQTAMMIFVYNAACTFAVHVVRARGRLTRERIVGMALAQLLLDALAVCVLVHFTGGVENVFLALVLVPVVIATELLPQRIAYGMALLVAALINGMAWGTQQGWIPAVRIVWPGHAAVRTQLQTDMLYVLQFTAAMTVGVFFMVFVASTISARLRRREIELEEAYAKLTASDEVKSFFMRKAGHEMRAPLAAIHSILDAVIDSSRLLEDRQRKFMERAQFRLKALMALVDEMRRYSRLRSAAEAVKPERINFGQIVRQTEELFIQRAKDESLTMTSDVDDVTIEADEEMMRELVTNLTANAIQYTPAGGHVELTLLALDGQAVFRVADTGIGISAEAMESLFQEFYRSPQAREIRAEGTGLGLSICKRIVEIHGGRIDVAPRPGGGTAFTARLPLPPRGSGKGKAPPKRKGR